MLDGAESDHLVSLVDGFGTLVLYIDVRQCKRAHDFAEEGGFLVVGLDEGEGDVGGPKFDRYSGEAGTGAEVGETDANLRGQSPTLSRTRIGTTEVVPLPVVPAGRVFLWEKVACSEEGLAEVAGDDLFWIADGGEVDAGIPSDQ